MQMLAKLFLSEISQISGEFFRNFIKLRAHTTPTKTEKYLHSFPPSKQKNSIDSYYLGEELAAGSG